MKTENTAEKDLPRSPSSPCKGWSSSTEQPLIAAWGSDYSPSAMVHVTG